jgi:peptide/nickel transport system permease protein
MEARLAGEPFDLGASLLSTLSLDGVALLIAAIVCVALGALARYRLRAATIVVETIRPLSLAAPAYVLGPLLILAVGSAPFTLSGPLRLLLPALTLAVGALAITLAQVRLGMFSFSRASGSWAVIGLYLVGAIVSGTFVVEPIFDWPGVGTAGVSLLFLVGAPPGVFHDLPPLWGIILGTMALYLVVALPLSVVTGFWAQRGAVTSSKTAAPASERSLPRRAGVTLLGVGSVLVAALALAVIFAPLLTHNNPTFIDLSAMNGSPSAAHPLGTDDLGRDMLSRVLYAGRVSLAIGALAVVVAGVAGLALGALLGLIPSERQRIGAVLDGTLTALTAFPALVFAFALVVALKPSFTSLVVAFTITQLPAFARLGLTLMRARGQNAADPSLAARGQSNVRAPGSLLAQASISMALVIVGASAVTFFGDPFTAGMTTPGFLGVPQPLFDWGSMISEGRGVPSAWLILAPALALGIGVIGLSAVGEALRFLLE